MTRPSKPSFIRPLEPGERTLTFTEILTELKDEPFLENIKRKIRRLPSDLRFEVFQVPEVQTFRREVKAGMGFFKKAFGFVSSAVKGLLGIPAKAKAVVRAAPKLALAAGGAVAGGALFAGGEQLFNAQGQPVAGGGLAGVVNPATGRIGGIGGGNGLFSTITTVTTINNQTGQPVRQQMFQGRPFIMSKEVAHLRSTIKKINRAHGKVPTRTRKASLNSMIQDAIKHSILHKAEQTVGAATA